MQDLGFDVLLKGSNMQRLLIGLWTSLRISLIAVVISIFSRLDSGSFNDKEKYNSQGVHPCLFRNCKNYASAGITFYCFLWSDQSVWNRY